MIEGLEGCGGNKERCLGAACVCVSACVCFCVNTAGEGVRKATTR